MERTLYGADHETYRHTVGEFLEREVVPHKDRWDDQHMIDRDVYRRAAEAGIYALDVLEECGGAGEADYRYRPVVCEEVGRVNALSFGLTLGLQDDLVLHYLTDLTDEEQRFTGALPVSAAGKILKARRRAEYAGRPGPAGRSAEGTDQRDR